MLHALCTHVQVECTPHLFMRYIWLSPGLLSRTRYILRKNTSEFSNYTLSPNCVHLRRHIKSISDMSKEKLDAIPDVAIDPDGVFKYILMQVSSKSGESKVIVRGDDQCDYHADIFDMVSPGIYALGLDCEALGGGRIDHKSAKKSILVYGYSMGYGKADHSITCALLKKRYPDYESITFSNDGY